MRSYDLSPLMRSTIGFDRLGPLFDTVMRSGETSYPPYNIEKTGDEAYRVSIAVAGFKPEDVEVTWQSNLLTVTGHQKEKDGGAFLHRGIAGRAFQQKFHLADHIKVVRAGLENGLLNIELAREVPEALKPRRIEVTASAPATIEHRAAA